MKTTNLDAINEEILNKYEQYVYVDVLGSRERQVILNTSDRYSEEAVRILNMISGNGIEKISFNQFYYVVNNTKIGISNMSTSEQFFLISYCYKVNKKPVMFIRDPRLLSDRVKKIYTEIFRNVDNILLCFEDIGLEKHFLRLVGDLK